MEQETCAAARATLKRTTRTDDSSRLQRLPCNHGQLGEAFEKLSDGLPTCTTPHDALPPVSPSLSRLYHRAIVRKRDRKRNVGWAKRFSSEPRVSSTERSAPKRLHLEVN